jgi:16S rRNA (cytosine967-C5)-methyltransferase
MPISLARRIAFDVLLRVESGSWASELLRAETEQVDARDAGLAHQIVFGVLRRRRQMDHLIALGTKGKRLDTEVRIALRMGLFQIRHLDRVPGHAIVSDSVQLVKRARKTSASGLVNAILRNQSITQAEVPEIGVPDWMYRRWCDVYGVEKGRLIALAAMDEPATFIRSATAPAAPHETTDIAGCYRLLGSGSAENLRTQDIGSQWVVTLLQLDRPGLRFLDVCAAPGNKTAQAMESGASAIACDRHLHRLRPMLTLGCPLVNIDATSALPFRGPFDRILVDAPCSGTGTLARNPEIQWNLKPEDLIDLQGRQVRILKNALDLLAPGGVLIYSTCSLEPEENEAVVGQVLQGTPAETQRRVPGIDRGDGFFAAIIRK